MSWQQRLVEQWQQPRPGALLLALRPLAWVYGALAAAHRALYASGLRRARRAPRPVIVVGNLVAGGAGKTPAVIALVEQLRALGRRPGVLSRGHGRQDDGVRLVSRDSTADAVGDEPLLIHLRTGVPVAVGRDRVAAAEALCAAFADIDLLIADDGLQHLALQRELQILVFDDRGAGNHQLLPAGPLRQPMPDSLPERTLVLYSHGVQSTPLPGALGERRLAGFTPLADWWNGAAPQAAALDALRARPLLAAAGLARPEPFFRMLEALGLRIGRMALPDHARFDALPWPASTPDVIVTEKDAVKLRPDAVGTTRVWVATLDFRLPPDFGRNVLDRLEGSR
ncbi:tetraacyldisaccharide 4'-kinase [Aquincola sp. S2]|uniref:Tetraacyldisaccharide 4'-kinase n=1 Tax=Pseudaquabacterium terrae TaxID=2732868 RepID=A0ABX2ENB6_9BURK|nr:tetraacyldisaccharide 4'-kinase [Aquabacterium terrae]NRF70063.1 tetraacyldisaccharide 4'-kinase [Aquabacterium terrae]